MFIVQKSIQSARPFTSVPSILKQYANRAARRKIRCALRETISTRDFDNFTIPSVKFLTSWDLC